MCVCECAIRIVKALGFTLMDMRAQFLLLSHAEASSYGQILMHLPHSSSSLIHHPLSSREGGRQEVVASVYVRVCSFKKGGVVQRG